MKFARISVLGLALVAGLAAAWVAKDMLGARKPVAQVKSKFDTVKVLTASADISLGNVLQHSSLKWQEWPESAVSSSLVTEKNQPDAIKKFTGAIVRSSFVAGEPILSHKVVLHGKGGIMSAILKSGMRAISTKIAAETSAGGFILPNDRVDVILTRRERARQGGERATSETILENVRVLAIDQTLEQQKDKSKVVVGKTATLELTPIQAEILAMSEKTGSLSLALRPLADSAKENTAQNDNGTRRRRRGTVTVLRYGITSRANPRY